MMQKPTRGGARKGAGRKPDGDEPLTARAVASPSPQEVRAARESLGLTQGQAGALINYSARGWQNFEAAGAENRRMPPIVWQAWRHLAGIERMPFGGAESVSKTRA